MKNKRGQFYIIAAIIIVLVLAGIASVRTYTITKSRPETITDMASTLNVEGSQVVDFGIYTGQEGDEMNELLEDFTTNFSNYFAGKTQQTDMVLVYGGEGNNLVGQKITTQDTGGVQIAGTGVTTQITEPQGLTNENYRINTEDNTIT